MLQLSASELLAFATIRIECDTPVGVSAGTGFFHRFCDKNGRHIPAIVTNRHVVKGATKLRFHIHLANSTNIGLPLTHTRFELPTAEEVWIGHPDPTVDLCVTMIGPLVNHSNKSGQALFFQSLSHELIPSDAEWSELMQIEEVVMIGYPNGIWDAVNNMPIFRRGITATHPNLRYAGRQEFMIDAACFPGSSGSPVLLYNFGTFTDRKGGTHLGTRIKLLGVLYAGPQLTTKGEIVIMSVPTSPRPVAVSQIPINLGVVISSKRLRDFDAVIEAAVEQLQIKESAAGGAA